MHACSHSLWIGSEATLGEAKIPISDGARASGCLLTESISRERERERESESTSEVLHLLAPSSSTSAGRRKRHSGHVRHDVLEWASWHMRLAPRRLMKKVAFI